MEVTEYLRKFPIGFQWQDGTRHYEVVGHETITKDTIEYGVWVKKRYTYVSHDVRMYDTSDFRLGIHYHKNMSTKKIEKKLKMGGVNYIYLKHKHFDENLFEI